MSLRDGDRLHRVAEQPVGVRHLVRNRDQARSFCGVWLIDRRQSYCFLHEFGADPCDCRKCAQVLDQRARFPEKVDEGLKPVLDRIAKLLALSESPNENEAAVALERAHQLLEKYNLARDVVRDPVEQKPEKRETECLGAQVAAYKYTLLGATAHLHDVGWYRKSTVRAIGGERRSSDKHGVFVGLPGNVAAAVMTFSFLLATADAFYRAARKNGAAANGREYRLGFADRISHRIRELKRAASVEPGVAELMRVSNAIAREAMAIEEYFYTGSGFSFGAGYTRDSEDYQHGYRDGESVDLHGAQTSRLLDEGR